MYRHAFALFLVASLSASAATAPPAPEAAYYCQLGALVVASNPHLETRLRQDALDYADRQLEQYPSDWSTLKQYLLRMAATDPAFLLDQYPRHRRLFEEWLQGIDLRWLGPGPSPFPALKRQALSALRMWLRSNTPGAEGKVEFTRRLIDRLQSTEPTLVD